MPQIMGKEVGSIGYGLMGLTWNVNAPPTEEAFKAMKAALASGCNFWNAGEFYGTPENNSLTLLNKYFTRYPEDAEKVVLSVKGGLVNMRPDGSPEGIRRSVENCLRYLDGKKHIDMFEPARVDKNNPFEVTLKVLEEFVAAGKIGGISLSEVSAATIRKAVDVTKIVAVEVEYSLFSLDILNNGVAEACAEYQIPIVAYSPLGRGMLTGAIKSLDDIPEGDFRKSLPRYQKENFNANLELVEHIKGIAARNSCTPGQLAISWTIQSSNRVGTAVYPIPGATKESRVLENARQITLTGEDTAEIDSILSQFETKGARYAPAGMAHVEG